jgi:drug/metabolite transporter (DMT)-like permease
VFIFGFTGILGRVITLDEFNTVWYRMLIAFLGLAIFSIFWKKGEKLSKKSILMLLGTGVITAAHWITFFGSIKASNVSVALACISSAALFTSLIEPLFFKRRFDWSELVLGIATVIGIVIITQAAFEYWLGITLSLISAMLAALFGTLNGVFVRKGWDSVKISTIEMLGGFLALTIYLVLSGKTWVRPESLGMNNLFWLLILGIICTSFAFVASVFVMKELSPFTVALSINLEPIYAIILAVLLFPESEKMTWNFYLGAVIIILTVMTNAILKKRKRKKLMLQQTPVLP